MLHIAMPSRRSLVWAVWPLAGLLVAMAFMSPRPESAVLLLTCACACLLIVFVVDRRDARQLARTAEKMARDLDAMTAAEELAGLGRWCIECAPEKHFWSEEMCQLIGLAPGTAPDKVLLRRIMPEGMAQIDMCLAIHAQDREAFSLEFEVAPKGESPRVLRANVRNLFDDNGVRERIFMVVRNVSCIYALERDRDAALRAAEQARLDADTDAMTQLASRRRTMAELDRAVIEARTGGEPLSIIMFDIDRFKTINDSHGHPVGDKVIKTVAAIAQRQGRASDTLGRIGGEEFLWIMPGCTSQSALTTAERLRWAIEAGTHSAPVPSVTISVGHAQSQDGEAPLMLFARVDEALYEAKRNGRNRVARAA